MLNAVLGFVIKGDSGLIILYITVDTAKCVFRWCYMFRPLQLIIRLKYVCV